MTTHDGALDLRLAGVAAGTWLTGLAALHLSVRLSLLIAGVAVLLTALMCALGSRPSAGPFRGTGRFGALGRFGGAGRGCGVGRSGGARWVVAGVLLGVACGAVVTAARVAVREAEPLAGLTRERAAVVARLTVRDDPRPLSAATGRAPTWLVPARLTWIAAAGAASGHRVDVRVLVLGTGDGWRGLLPGQRVEAEGRLMPARGGDLTAAVLAVDSAPQPRGTASWAQRAAGTLRAGLQRACATLPAEPGGLLPGLVVGDTSRLDPAVEEDFRTTGMTHLCAVSGANIAIVIGCVLFALRRVRAGPGLSVALAAGALMGFVILARPSPSVVRAGVMGAIALIALATSRPRSAVPALATTVVVLVVADPELAGDAGFALSVLATGGLLVFAGRWRDGLRRAGVPAGLAEALAVPAAAQVACGPVIAGLSGSVSLVAVPANLLAAPAVAPATVLGVITAVVSPLWPDAAELTAWAGGWPARWLVLVARIGARVPSGTVPWPAGAGGGLLLAALTIVLLLAFRRPPVRRVVAAVTAAVVLGALPVRLIASGWPPAGWVVAGCAVGQGDATVLPLGGGQAVVIDAGPDTAPVDRCLRDLGIHRVPMFAVSHFHQDHVGGVAGVFRGRRVDAVVTTAWPEPAAGHELVHAEAARHGTPVFAATAGWHWSARDVTVEVIGPPAELRGTRSDPNNNSLVLRATVAGVRILLMGDAENEEQDALLRASAAVRTDVLKLAHHGSAFQSPEFLAAVDPAVVLVSVGTDNEYGHPNLPLLARLSRDGARVLRTDEQGDLAAVRTRDGLAVVVRGVP
ncbi:ComEC/Rec2 family competence protein [Catenuloplanes indicus]|uniref:Competence protein ComEC n=1 Tax=Catenuloplanes indicus TaxID=137267 RepID=A0AAE3VZY0_9ACTN|nr:ComEC/Rec2 family competence protein [Catenuloplanes indicus]MDQ0366284.1 competence protein ComEC [Catenuloplanes indicus]